MIHRVNIVIPVKLFRLAKSRLSTALPSASRQRLMQSLFRKNLEFLHENFPGCHLLVVTPDRLAAQWAKALGATVLLEDECEGLNAAIEKATRWSVERKFCSQLIFFADIAGPKAEDVDRLLQFTGKQNSLVAVSATDGGTNALLANPPHITPHIFGEHSYLRLQRYAQKNDIQFVGLNLESLALDIDRPADLLMLNDSQFLEAAS
ncbi:2-phospho-L-lactate guanylyltransferase [Aestuariicella sp. G3-2]|uniref:2-phospho-L-lactate guanylyltransferase n=1 Tax=Pseudomaricurvus albidus TaxID=2842452 RepID=UPI001C0BA6E6|nr:2-phospho-L-lactate guanylyltransferase [Aestuariicella albida]